MKYTQQILREAEQAEKINETRLALWKCYYNNLKVLEELDYLELPKIPEGCIHNAHMFYIKVEDLVERGELISFLKERPVILIWKR